MAQNGTRLLAKIVSDPDNVAHRLAYADWLEKNGDSALANFIRARCALDNHVPDPEVYPTLIERLLESLAGQREPAFELPPGFSSGCWWSSTSDAWWSDSSDLLEGGLLSFVKAEEGDVESLVAGVADLVRTTPVRGIEFRRNCLEHLPVVLSSPAGRQLRRIELDGSAPEGTSVSPIQAVVNSPAAPALTRLEIGHFYPLNDGDAAALAVAPFHHLARLDVPSINCSPTGLGRLQNATWFRHLRRLLIGFNPACARDGARRLGGMPALHTLSLWMPDASVLLGLGEAEPLPDLRRLYIYPADLRGDSGMALGRLKAPRLIELCLSGYNRKLGKADLKALAATPIFDGLRVLTFDGIQLTHTALDAVAASPCAKKLRIFRLQSAAFRSLTRSGLAQPGALPALTTLVLYRPFTNAVKDRDTASFLAVLDTPALRHLTLEHCDFDDSCMDAIVSNPAFAGLTRLVIRGRYDRRGKWLPILQPKKLRAFLRSANLRNLTVLAMWDCQGGVGTEVLADEEVLPCLTQCTLYGVTKRVAEALSKRPEIKCIATEE